MSRLSKFFRKAEKEFRTKIIHRVVPREIQNMGNKFLAPYKKLAHEINAPFKILANVTDSFLKKKKEVAV